MTTRQLKTIGTDPGGVSGQVWTEEAKDSIREIWKLLGGVLTNVSGTNDITGNLEFGGTSFDGHTNGLKFTFVAPATNTGAMTVSIQGITAVPLKDIKDAEIAAGAVTQGMICFCQIVGSTAYLVSTGASSAAATSSGVVKKAWKMTKAAQEVKNTTTTLITIGGVQGELGDVLRLPPMTIGRGTVTLSGDNHPENVETGCQLYYNPQISGFVSNQLKIELFRDATLIATLFNYVGTGSNVSDIDYGPFPGYIEILDSNSHDYSIKGSSNRGDNSVGAVFNGVAELISQPVAAV